MLALQKKKKKNNGQELIILGFKIQHCSFHLTIKLQLSNAQKKKWWSKIQLGFKLMLFSTWQSNMQELQDLWALHSRRVQ